MKNNTTSISPAELMQKLQKQDDILLVDVREDWEHKEYNIGGTLIPMNLIFEKIDLIPKDRLVVVYCEKGIRSQVAIQRLQQRFQYDNLVNLSGGMDGWRRETKAGIKHPH